MPPVSVGAWRVELYPGSMRSVAVLAFVAVPALASCALSPQIKRAQAISDAKEKVTRSASAEDAIALAEAIHTAYEQGDYASNFAQLSADVLSAQYALDRATTHAGSDAPVVLVWRGVLFEDTGRVTEAREQYRQSFGLRPSYLAASKLVPIYGTLHDADSIVDVCTRTYPTTNTADRRIALVDLCRQELALLVPKDQVLAWLDPEVAAWYRREVDRREKAELAKQEQQRLRKERAEKVAAYMQKCSATCHDRGVACQDRCSPGDPACQERCETSYGSCVDACEAAAHKAITSPPTGASSTSKKAAEAEGVDRRSDPSARAASRA